MALIKCSNCGKKISDQASICPHCNHSFVSMDYNMGAKIWLLICIVLNSITAIAALSGGVYLQGIIAFSLAAANTLLLFKKRPWCFLVLLIVITMVCVANVVSGVPIMSAIFGYLNPLITYLLTMNYWKKLRGVENGIN